MNRWTGPMGNLRPSGGTSPLPSLLDAGISWLVRAFQFGRSRCLRASAYSAAVLVSGLGCGRELGPISTPPESAQVAPSASVVLASPMRDRTAVSAGLGIAGSTSADISEGFDAGPKQTAELHNARHVAASRRLVVTPGKRSVAGMSGMVVSVNAEASRVGVELLKLGGNAVDAIVAVALVLAVTHPSAGNIGGGGFALVHLANGETLALDFRESSPERLDRQRYAEMMRAGGEGPDSVAIPGTVAGLFELATRFGRLPFATLVEPARRLAESGHRVSTREAMAIRSAWPKLRHEPLARRLYGRNTQQPIQAGSWLKLPQLASSLARLQAAGRDGFYKGPVAASVVASLGQDPQIGETDLAAYRAVWRQPLEIPYRDLRVLIMPPPSAGGVALATGLLMLSAYDPSTMRRGSTPHAHLLLEIMRRAQADRVYGVVDPDVFSEAQREASLNHLLAPQRWLERCPIDPDRATPNQQIVEHQAPVTEMEHTTHLAVTDNQGMAVSLTTTLSSGFGSKVITDTGVVLNNALASFSGNGQNQPLPHRRTTSSMAPTMVEDALGLRLILGTPGGDTIPSTLLQLLNSLIDYSIPLDQAVDAPRLHQSIAPGGQARLERSRPIPLPLQRGLGQLGHQFVNPTSVMGHANSIAVVDRRFFGYVDPREGGLALGWKGESPRP
jgi:gamma-glutamyltranspeptidase / glutathione hydrolase